MDGISSATSSPLYALAASAGGSGNAGSSGSDVAANSIGPAASLELSVLQQQSQGIATLLGSLNTAASSSMFAGGGMLSLLNAQGSSAMAYLTPQAAPVGQRINALA